MISVVVEIVQTFQCVDQLYEEITNSNHSLSAYVSVSFGTGTESPRTFGFVLLLSHLESTLTVQAADGKSKHWVTV